MKKLILVLVFPDNEFKKEIWKNNQVLKCGDNMDEDKKQVLYSILIGKSKVDEQLKCRKRTKLLL